MTDIEKLALFVLTALTCPLCVPLVIDMIERKEE